MAQELTVEKVPPELQPTDAEVLKAISAVGADKEYVELTKDYGLWEGATPYSRTYTDRKSDYRFLEVSQLPMVDAEDDKLKAGWFLSGGNYYSNTLDKSINNLFGCSVIGTQVTLVVENDQPYGAKAGHQVQYDPQLFLDGKAITPASVFASRYDIDPYNENYWGNVLEWNYGICWRQIRLVEGMYRETWVFINHPKGEVRIVHNQTGNFSLSLGQYAIDDDTELVPASVFDEAEYPLTISASATFYPDADPETSSVDGTAMHAVTNQTWATVHDGAGTHAYPNEVGYSFWMISCGNSAYNQIRRSIFVFDTSGLPDDAIISAATFSVYGYAPYTADNNGITPGTNIYSSSPASPTAVVAGDYDSLGSTAYCDTDITYANLKTGDPGDSNDFAFNATGLAAISKTGVTEIGGRDSSYDAPNNDPLCGGSNTWSGFGCWFADKGTGYKPKLVVTYTTVTIPTVTTQVASSVDETTATGNGNITNTGGENCDERGFDYDIDSGAPYMYDAVDAGSYGTGAYTKGLTGLSSGTRYYIRAKAHNSAGWGYGGETTFATLPGAVTDFAIGSTTESSATLTWTKGAGSEKTMVRYNIGSYPTGPGDGTQAYFDTGSTVTVPDLSPDIAYYFSAWAYDDDSGLYSTSNASLVVLLGATPGGDASLVIIREVVPLSLACIVVAGIIYVGTRKGFNTLTYLGIVFGGLVAYYFAAAIINTLLS